MAATTVNEQNFNKIDKLISSSRFNEAFLLLKRDLKAFPILQNLHQKVNEAEATYKYLLNYMADGHDDPSRKDVLDGIKDLLMRANAMVFREKRLVDSPDLYSSTKRLQRVRNNTFNALLDNFKTTLNEATNSESKDTSIVITPEIDSALEDIFNYVWTLNGIESDEFEQISNLLDDSSIPEYLKLQIISALILGNLEYFDPQAFEILLNVTETDFSLKMKARAIVGVILLSLLHSRLIASNLSLKSRLMISAGDEEKRDIVKDVLFNIIRTYDTKRIDNKMKNEVIPGLMKLNPEIIDKMRNMASDSEDFLSDANPEWEELIENSELGEKLREINDLQMEGADVMVTAFSNLKNFPFFTRIAHWFLPVVEGNYEFNHLPLIQNNNILKRLTSVMCESDVHSFLISLGQMPEQQRDRMLSNIELQMKEAEDALSGPIGETDHQKLIKEIRHSLQDLYRFFKYYKRNKDFSDPFGSPFLSSHIQPLIQLFDLNSENLRLIAEFYFKHKYFDEASGMFELVDNLSPGDDAVWQKIGFSHDRMQRYDKAVDWYMKYDIINPGNQWVVKKLAVALKNMGENNRAIEYYRKALVNEPENYHLLMSAAQCLIDNGEYDEAKHHLYHAKYLKPDKLDVNRAIAWTEALSGNYEKSGQIYDEILVNPEVDKIDYLNAAHNALATKDMQKAFQLYKKFVVSSENNINNLVIALRDDSQVLSKLGINTKDLRLIVDKIRYDLFE